MSVYSMTGYATAQSEPAPPDVPGGPVLGLEVRSVNSRFLDLSFKLPDDLRACEPALRELIGRELRRGKVEVRGWLEGKADGVVRVPSSADLQRLNHAQDAIRAWLPHAAALSVAEVLQFTTRVQAAPGHVQDECLAVAAKVLAALKAAREREGRRLADMLLNHCEQLQQLVARVRPMVPQLVEQQRQRFLERWHEALGAAQGAAEADTARERALAEATAFAIRIDVAEELTRIGSHLTEIQSLLQHGGELGKRLDFLIQELHREANTLGSKSASLDLTRASVDMKVLIEQMREQVQNLE